MWVRSDNLAKKSGGAIAVQGSAKVVVTVLESVFDSNAVETPLDAGAVDLTVRLNTVRVMGILPAAPASLSQKCHQFQGGFTIDPASDLTDITTGWTNRDSEDHSSTA